MVSGIFSIGITFSIGQFSTSLIAGWSVALAF
jgi:hypothetical protein